MKSITSHRESDIEKYLVKRVDEIGGESRKVKWIGRDHAPDRAVFYKGVYFVELKRPGEVLRPGQLREHFRLKQLGANMYVVSTLEQVDRFVDEIRSERIPADRD